MTVAGESTAARIGEAARQLIMRRGYSGFSYADIADAIHIRKASIHHHFPVKADLVIAVVKQSREAFDADIASLEAAKADPLTHPLTQLRAYIGYWERCIADESAPFCVAGMLGAELPALPDEVAREVRLHFENLGAWVTRVLEAGVEARLLKLGRPAEAEAASLVSSIYGAMLAARAYGDASLFEEVTSAAVERLVKPRRTAKAA